MGSRELRAIFPNARFYTSLECEHSDIGSKKDSNAVHLEKKIGRELDSLEK